MAVCILKMVCGSPKTLIDYLVQIGYEKHVIGYQWSIETKSYFKVSVNIQSESGAV